jgi:5'(3')-deoxyribonucleotidase
MEATLTGAIPIVPDRCSYKEMYLPAFKYPSEWTSSFEAYTEHKQDLEKFIQDKLDNYENYIPFIKQQQDILIKDYLKADIMIDNLLSINTTSHNGDN